MRCAHPDEEKQHLMMYAYCCGIYSSRKMAAATCDVIPFRVLNASLQAEPEPA
jgi:hypothetical protein